MKKPGDTAVKTLFALSGNVCSFRDEDGPRGACEQRLADPAWKRVMGEICHIYGEKPGSARYTEAHEDDGHEEWNLILLCPNHHTVIDDTEPQRFTPEVLFEMKDRAAQANGPAAGSANWCTDEFLDRIVAAALATYERAALLPPLTAGEDPTASGTTQDEPDQFRSELAFHRAWARELEDRHREDGLDADELAQMIGHKEAAARLDARLKGI